MSNAAGIEVHTADGRWLRYAADEVDATKVPMGLAHDSTIPGGYATCSFELAVRVDEELPFGLLDDIRLFDGANRTLWEGLVAKTPRQSASGFSASVQCVGHSARLKWPTGWKRVYLDQDVTHWEQPPFNRRAAFAAAGAPLEKDYTSAAENGGITQTGTTGQPIPALSSSELWYEMPVGERIARVGYKGTEKNLTSMLAAGVRTTSSDAAGGTLNALTLDDTVRSTVIASPERYANLLAQASAGHTPAGGAPFSRMFSKVGVYGDHGLTLWPVSGGLDGLYPHDVLAHMLSEAAPDLTYTVGPEGSIVDNTGYILAQLAFLEPTTAEDAILEINKYFNFEWGVYDNKQFFWRGADPERLCWDARLDQGDYLGLEGADADDCVNGFLVNYTLPDGTSKTAGPPGSGCDVEDAVLGDSDPLNVVNAQGTAAKYGEDTISTVTDDTGAVQFGFVRMAELSLPARKGTITLTGTVEHPTKGSRPVNEIKAGDWIRISDHPADVPRRIIQATHNNDARTCDVDVGSDVEKVDAILQQVFAASQAAGF